MKVKCLLGKTVFVFLTCVLYCMFCLFFFICMYQIHEATTVISNLIYSNICKKKMLFINFMTDLLNISIVAHYQCLCDIHTCYLQIAYKLFRTVILLYYKISVPKISQTTKMWTTGSSGLQVRSIL